MLTPTLSESHLMRSKITCQPSLHLEVWRALVALASSWHNVLDCKRRHDHATWTIRDNTVCSLGRSSVGCKGCTQSAMKNLVLRGLCSAGFLQGHWGTITRQSITRQSTTTSYSDIALNPKATIPSITQAKAFPTSSNLHPSFIQLDPASSNLHPSSSRLHPRSTLTSSTFNQTTSSFNQMEMCRGANGKATCRSTPNAALLLIFYHA